LGKEPIKLLKGRGKQAKEKETGREEKREKKSYERVRESEEVVWKKRDSER